MSENNLKERVKSIRREIAVRRRDEIAKAVDQVARYLAGDPQLHAYRTDTRLRGAYSTQILRGLVEEAARVGSRRSWSRTLKLAANCDGLGEVECRFSWSRARGFELSEVV